MKNFLALPNLIDMRASLPKDRSYIARNKAITTRVWHNSLTLSHLKGSDAASFAKYHIDINGWPGVAYHVIIEPKNVIDTPRGKRARIVWAHDFDRRTYHAGNANDYSLGICVAGDYRNETMPDYVKATIDELQAALNADRIGREDKSHHEMPGYSWKACCNFDYLAIFKFLDGKAPVTALPGKYTIQEGDTFWNIANNLEGITVADLIAANPGVDYQALKIGQTIKLGDAKGAVEQVSAPVAPKTPAASAPKAPAGNTVRVGQSVTLSATASKYATGETIPDAVKGKRYTVLQTGLKGVLLKEILSWVKGSDLGAATREFIQLPRTAATWRTYKLNVLPRSENSDWSLTPAKFGGLEYEILGRPGPDLATIKTSRGNRNIYIAPSTGAKTIRK